MKKELVEIILIVFIEFPLFGETELIQRIKSKDIIEPYESMKQAPDIPPHIEQMKLQRELLRLCQRKFSAFNTMIERFGEQINEIDER